MSRGFQERDRPSTDKSGSATDEGTLSDTARPLCSQTKSSHFEKLGAASQMNVGSPEKALTGGSSSARLVSSKKKRSAPLLHDPSAKKSASVPNHPPLISLLLFMNSEVEKNLTIPSKKPAPFVRRMNCRSALGKRTCRRDSNSSICFDDAPGGSM